MQSVVTTTTDDLVNDLFGGTGNPGADDLLGGAQDKESEEGTGEPDVEAAEAVQGRTEKKKVVTPLEEVNNDQYLNELVGDDAPATGTEDKKKPGTTPKRATNDTPAEIEIGFKEIYEKFVEDGVWQEVEIPDGTPWDVELFKQIQNLQIKHQYDDLLDKTGPVGKSIIEYEQNGGKPSELINLFQEQRTIQDFDISDADGQDAFLRAFYDAQDYSEKSIERIMSSLSAEDKAEEAQEKKGLWDSQFEAEIEARKKEQALYAKQVEEASRNFQKNITQAVTADADLTPTERRSLKDYVLNYTKEFQGKQVSQFYADMVDIQKDPASYLELAKFIKGLKTGEYKKKIEDKTKKEVKASTFVKIKNSSAVRSSDAANPDLDTAGESTFLSGLGVKKK